MNSFQLELCHSRFPPVLLAMRGDKSCILLNIFSRHLHIFLTDV